MSINILTNTAFADWIDKNRDPYTEYRWDNSHACACAQYAQAMGIECWYENICEPGFWQNANETAHDHPRIWGALAARLRGQADA